MTAIVVLLIPQVSFAEFSATVEQELALDDDINGQKFESIFQPEWNISLADEIDMTIIARARYDGFSNLGPRTERPENYAGTNGPLISGSHGDLSIREWYLDTEIGGAFWRLGKQQVVWGQADGLKVLDVVNPQSFREFILDDFDDSRIPLWAINVEVPVGGDDSLQVLWIPDLTYHEFAEKNFTYEITSPVFVPQLPNGISLGGFDSQKPNSLISDSDFGLRYSKFYQGWDLTFNYLYHYHDAPVLYQDLKIGKIIISSVYERNSLIGATVSNAFGDYTLRAEIGYSSDTFHLRKISNPSDTSQNGIFQSADISSVIGIDWQGLEDTLISVQWFQSHLTHYEPGVVRPRNNNIVSLVYRQTFQNEIWELEILALHGFDQDDYAIQSKLNYALESNIKLWFGSDIFSGGSQGLFGQFKDQDRFTIGLEWGL